MYFIWRTRFACPGPASPAGTSHGPGHGSSDGSSDGSSSWSNSGSHNPGHGSSDGAGSWSNSGSHGSHSPSHGSSSDAVETAGDSPGSAWTGYVFGGAVAFVAVGVAVAIGFIVYKRCRGLKSNSYTPVAIDLEASTAMDNEPAGQAAPAAAIEGQLEEDALFGDPVSDEQALLSSSQS